MPPLSVRIPKQPIDLDGQVHELRVMSAGELETLSDLQKAMYEAVDAAIKKPAPKAVQAFDRAVLAVLQHIVPKAEPKV